MIVARLIPLLSMMLGGVVFRLLIAALLIGLLGYFWMLRPISLPPGEPLIQPIPAAPLPSVEGMV